tara:strand:+ start:3929 stop:5164 length:1236 start_codon:yes stop_codon:yes gene_type:complete
MMATSAHIVIIGASHAGLSCAERLRTGGFDGQITILERDPGLPLQRPPLSKTYLKADLTDGEGAFVLRKEDWFDNFKITFRPACEAASLDPVHQQLSLTDGSTLSYDHLVLATGALARPLPKAADPPNLHMLRTAADARLLRAGLADVRTALVIGGGYIGLEAAASLRSLDIDVHLVEMAPRLLARVASPVLSEHCAALHRRHGIQLHLGTATQDIKTDISGRITAVHLAGGQKLDTQLVLAGIGIVPDTALAEAAGLAVDNGIVTDADYRTSNPHISAIGDVARAPAINPVRVESIYHAQYSGAVVAARLTASAAPSHEAWWFWSDQYDVKYQMAGLVPAEAPSVLSVTRAGRRENSVSVWSYDGAELVSVEVANDPQAYMIGKKCLEAGLSPAPSDITNPDLVLKSLLN